MFSAIVIAILVPQPSATLAFGEHPIPIQQAAAPTAETEEHWPPAGVLRPGKGVVSPRLIDEVKPVFLADAMRAGVQGLVRMEAVVKTDGTVGEVRVAHSLDTLFGQDDECVRTLKQWRFKPGTKDGVPVPVVVEVEMTFVTRK